jgi:hypothetical protein
MEKGKWIIGAFVGFHAYIHKHFFLSLRAVLFSSSSNINAIVANCLLENEWGSLFNP